MGEPHHDAFSVAAKLLTPETAAACRAVFEGALAGQWPCRVPADSAAAVFAPATAATARGLTPSALVLRLTLAALNETLIDAILDDGEDA